MQYPLFKTPESRIELNSEEVGFTLELDEQTLREIRDIEENSRRALLLSSFILFD